MMEMRLVGLEGGIALHNAAEHNAESITNGDGKDC